MLMACAQTVWRCRLKNICAVLALVALTGFGLCPASSAEIWIETTQSDFADGEAPGGLGANIYASASGDVRMVANTWDLNQDGYKDIVFSNRFDNSTSSLRSYIYWGSDSGYSALDLESLPTHGASGVSVSDLNRDGFLDLVLSNSFTDGSEDIDSYIYWGSGTGYSVSNMDSLPTHGASLGLEKDLGSIHRRDSIEVYISSVFNAGEDAIWDSIVWAANAPLGSSVSISVRTGDTLEPDTTWSGWADVSNGEDIPDSLDSRCIQYRALMTTDYKTAPCLEEVSISWKPLLAVTLFSPNDGENWTVCDSHTIAWVAHHVSGVDSIDLHLSIDGGSDWSTIATGEANDFSYIWAVPPTPSESCLVKVVAYSADTVTGEDTSDSLFTISDDEPPEVTVLYPNGGEELLVGDTVDIEWVTKDNGPIDSVSVSYSTSGGFDWHTLSTGETNDSLFTWEVPPTPSTHCLVKIEVFDVAPNIGVDTSDSLFTIFSTAVEELDGNPPSTESRKACQTRTWDLSLSTINCRRVLW